MSMTPRGPRSVDICVPSYNYARYLEQCAGSVLSQAGVDVRVLIIDDASTDDTAEIGARIAASDFRVEFRRHTVNAGHLATYNEGIAWASGTYFMLLSADDLLAPGSLDRAVRVMEAHDGVGMVHGEQISFSEEPPDASGTDEGEPEIMDGRAFVAACCASGVNTVSTPTVVLRTRVQKRVGGYREGLPHTADLEMWMRVAGHGHAIARLPTVQAFRRRHAAAMHIEYTTTGIGDLQQLVAAFESFFRDPRCAVPGCCELREKARRTLGVEAFWRANAAFDRGDVASFREFLEIAVDLSPDLRETRSWSRLMWKRRAGSAIWRGIRTCFGG